MSVNDPLAGRLDALREATAAVRPTPGFADRVVAAAQAAVVPPVRAPIVCGWRYAVPAAALVAIVAGVLAWRTHADLRRVEAGRELGAALADPAVGDPW